ncbi:EAL domain-containing protein [Rhodoplanes sp. TEM]|uniref:EAL domain-containing protein n=1 Tax=Rhodoplanes tepidamans TaxID=200616 RepID=A0ABT5J8B3_RHOTP|nr:MULTISPECIES: EAL domain-containing protein [Rhodoplanes]MDC7785816.1 EAL domain-containing protein [Rhodoplanes tepidamans]MDC7984083.1 EAL domain-containing protein [Rhodoplanes sp. TEM]MDQ0354621.1 diguanylate cyclase (GGDEF)-like protein [Rhodoplanes tepidamans]
MQVTAGRKLFGGHGRKRLPADVHAELIAGLYTPLPSLMLGWGSSVLIGAVVSLRTGSAWLTAVSVTLALVAAARLWLVLAYRRAPIGPHSTVQTVRRWETLWVAGAWSFAALLGLLCLAASLAVDDPVVHLLADAATIGYTAGATARNAGRPPVAIVQIVLTLVPIALGALLHGGAAYQIFAVVTLLYLAAAVELAVTLGRRSLRHLLEQREKSALARSLADQNMRFEAALSNMSHGLCMFDRRGRLVVSNTRLCEIYRLPPGTFRPGMTVREMLARSIGAGNHPGRDAAEMTAFFEGRLAGGAPSSSTMAIAGDRTILLSQWPIADGGAVVLFEDVTERERAVARAEWLATHDELTGLPNRALFGRTLDEVVARAGRRRFAVLFLDLDRFKYINDTLGHAAGDLLLKEVATRLASCVGADDVVSRLGGDEFLVLLRSVSDADGVAEVARAILAAVAAPIVVLDQECRISVSIGGAFYPTDGHDAETLARNADAAMYLAKEEGRGCFRLFSPVIERRSFERLVLETGLRGALERNELVLHYQPKRRIATGDISGIEALVRWRHPALGLVSPARFVPLAEETGLIVPIGRWVLATACAQAVAWQNQGLAPLRVAVNLSPRQFADESLLADIEAALAQSGLRPDLLELEITETVVVENFERTLPLLTALRERGVHLAIDDFGTGYSSMALVKQFPVDTIKIDSSFIRDVLDNPDDAAIAEAILALGKALDVAIVAEGVETEAQEAFLRARGCDQIQGYLFSRPLPADEIAAFVASYELSRLKALTATAVGPSRPRATPAVRRPKRAHPA